MTTDITVAALPEPLNSTQRRKIARKICTTLDVDMDVALAAAAIVRPPARSGATDWTLRDTSDRPDALAAPHTGIHRVHMPLIDPNIFAITRLMPHRDALPTPELEDDGVYTHTWDNPEQLATAFRTTFDHTMGHFDLFEDLTTAAAFGLDTWHDPLLLAPVRHQFADGTPTCVRWFTLDGSLRIWAMRHALRTLTPPGFIDHPYVHPLSDWNADPQITWRTYLAAARAAAEAEWQPMRVESWANLTWLGHGPDSTDALRDSVEVTMHLLRQHT